MAHPYKKHADYSHTNKAHSIGKMNNLDIPVMRAVGENSSKPLRAMSTASMQHRDQAAKDGMKKGGRTKAKHKVVIAAPPATPPLPDPTAAGAASSPVPAPPPGAGGPPGMPPMKRGGRTSKYDGNPEKLAKMTKYPLTGGSQSGIGRQQKARGGGGFKPLA